MPTALFTDADNTLWDTDAVYARAQLALLASFRRHLQLPPAEPDELGLAFLRRVDQSIAARHPDGLRFPPQLLGAALRRVLQGEPLDSLDLKALARDDVSTFASIIEEYGSDLGERPALRVGVVAGLSAIAQAGISTTVVTEGNRERCLALLDLHGLSSYVQNYVSFRKSAEAYRSLRQKFGLGLMVGDQIDRDILYSAQAGFRTCYFPSGFAPAWTKDLVVKPDHRISDYSEVTPLVLDRAATPASRRRRA